MGWKSFLPQYYLAISIFLPELLYASTTWTITLSQKIENIWNEYAGDYSI
jgi:hypothetical protein